MDTENMTYPLELDLCIQAISYDPTNIRKMSQDTAEKVYDCAEQIYHDLQEIILDDIRNVKKFREFIDKYEKWKGFYGSTIHTHIRAYLCAAETEEGNDQQKGETSAKVYDDMIRLRLIVEGVKTIIS